MYPPKDHAQRSKRNRASSSVPLVAIRQNTVHGLNVQDGGVTDIAEGVRTSLTQTRYCHCCSRLASCCAFAPSALRGFDRAGAIHDATRDAVCITRSHILPANSPTNESCALGCLETPGCPRSLWRAPERHLNDTSAALRPFPSTQSAPLAASPTPTSSSPTHTRWEKKNQILLLYSR